MLEKSNEMKSNKMVCTREDGGMWWNRCDGKTKDLFGDDESLACSLVKINMYYKIPIVIQSKQGRKKKECLGYDDFVNGTLLKHINKSNKIVGIKNDVIKIIV